MSRSNSRKQSELLEKQPPSDPDAERALLCAVLFSPAAYEAGRGIVPAKDMHDARNRAVWQAMDDVHAAGETIGAASLMARLRLRTTLADGTASDSAYWSGYIAELATKGGGLPSDVAAYAERIAACAARRASIDSAIATLRDAHDPKKTPAKTAAKTREPAARFVPFPVDALPEPVRGFVIAGAKAIGCDTSYIALPILTVLAAAIGAWRRLKLKHSWHVPAILWAVIVGESGTIKTPAFKLAMRPLRERQKKAIKRYQEAMQQHLAHVIDYEIALAKYKRGGKDAPEEPPEEPKEPQCERCIVSETTVQALAPLFLHNPHGLLMARDELAGWFGSFNQFSGGKGGADEAHWLSMFNGEALLYDRKTGDHRMISVPSAPLCICGGIQPAILHRALGREHRESGMAARLLLTCPPRTPKRWTDADIDPAIETDMEVLVDRLFSLEPAIGDDDEPRPVLVGLTADAKMMFEEYVNAHGIEHFELVGEMAAAWSKLEEYAARFALVIHFARWAANDPTLTSDSKLDAASMDAGIRLAQWFKNEARRVYPTLGETDEERSDRELIDLIHQRGGRISARQLTHARAKYRPKGAATAALESLAKARYGRWTTEPTDGRTETVFELFGCGNSNGSPKNPEQNYPSVTVTGVTAPESNGKALDRGNESLAESAAVDADDDWGDV